jgi:hypothetical protein
MPIIVSTSNKYINLVIEQLNIALKDLKIILINVLLEIATNFKLALNNYLIATNFLQSLESNSFNSKLLLLVFHIKLYNKSLNQSNGFVQLMCVYC